MINEHITCTVPWYLLRICEINELNWSSLTSHHVFWSSLARTAAVVFPVTVIMLIMSSIMAAQFAHFLVYGTKASIKDL